MSAENDAKLAALRAMPVEELAAELLEVVIGPTRTGTWARNREISAALVFGNYSRARVVSMDCEDKLLFAEALQHLQNRGAIALYAFNDHDALYVITRKGRGVLERGEHRPALG